MTRAFLPLLLVATPVLAEDPGALNYEVFENTIEHVNLEVCPEALASEGRFCRMTMANDAMHVFAFTEEGEQNMVGLRSYYVDQMTFGFE